MTLFPWVLAACRGTHCTHRIYFGISCLWNDDVFLKFPNHPKKVREFLPKNDWNFSLDESAEVIPPKTSLGFP